MVGVGQGPVAVEAEAGNLGEAAGAQFVAQFAEAFLGVAGPGGDFGGVFQAPGFGGAFFLGAHCQDEFDALEFGQGGEGGAGGGGLALLAGGAGLLSAPFVHGLGGVEEQALVGAGDGAWVVGVWGLDFEVAAFPGEDFLEGILAFEIAGGGVDDFAVLHPDFALDAALGDVEDGGALGEALELDEVDEALALHAAEAAFGGDFAAEEGFDAVFEELEFLGAAGFLPEEVDAQGIGAGAVFFVENAGENDDAQVGVFAADDGQDLQAIHFGHAEVGDEECKGFGFEQGDGAGAGAGGGDFGFAGEVAEQFLV